LVAPLSGAKIKNNCKGTTGSCIIGENKTGEVLRIVNLKFFKMRKKLLFGIGFLSIVAILFFNMEVSINNTNGSTTLKYLQTLVYADSECGGYDTDPNAYCKNKPSLNCGYCKNILVGIQCVESSAQNLDCYDVGH